MAGSNIQDENSGKEWFGMDVGNVWIADDFDEWPDEIWNAMTDPKIFPDDEYDNDDEISDPCSETILPERDME